MEQTRGTFEDVSTVCMAGRNLDLMGENDSIVLSADHQKKSFLRRLVADAPNKTIIWLQPKVYGHHAKKDSPCLRLGEPNLL